MDHESMEEWKGPVRQRKPTDKPWICVFLLFLILWIGIGIFAFSTGNVQSLFIATDSAGQKCGIDSKVKEEPYLLEIHLFLKLPLRVCRKECPSEDFVYPFVRYETDFLEIKKKMICTNEKALEEASDWPTLDHLVNEGICAESYQKSEPKNDECVPSDRKTEDGIELGKMLQDIKKFWYLIILGVMASAILSLGHIKLLQVAAKQVFYATIISILLLICTTIIYICLTSKDEGTKISFAITGGIIAFVVVLVCILARKKIHLACQIIQESTKAVRDLSSTLFLAFVPFTLQILVALFAGIIGLFLYSLTSPEYRVRGLNVDNCTCISGNYAVNSTCDPETFDQICSGACICQFVGFQVPAYVYVMHGVNLVALLWVIAFIAAVTELIFAGTFATWYYTYRKKDIPFSVLTDCISRTLRYHLGTAAFGGLLITICKMIRQILESAENKRNLFSVIVCSFAKIVLDGVVRIFSRDALIMCAIHGNGLFRSGLDAVQLIGRNILKFFVLNKVSEYLLSMGLLVIMLIMGLVTWYITNAGVIVGIVMYSSLLIGSVLLSVLTVAIDTLFICFLEDSEHESLFVNNEYKQLLEKN